ncbi:putative lipoprotein [Thermus thermophilus]|nr:putative lipoprotein [Thermus thermophilus]
MALEGETLGGRLTFFQARLAFPLEPVRVRRAGVNLFLENPNPLPLRVEGALILLGQRLSVRADLPAKGEARVQVVGFRPGLERGSGRLELRLEVPGFLSQTLVLDL